MRTKNALVELYDKMVFIGKKFEDIEYAAIHMGRDFDFDTEASFFKDAQFHDNALSLKTQLQDFNYDSGYGGQQLFGFVVFRDRTWLERGEYDGSEWWEYKKTPTREDLKSFLIVQDWE